MCKQTLLSVCCLLLVTGSLAIAQDDSEPSAVASEEATHEELRALRTRMFEAYKKRDVDALLKDVAPNVVITWQNGDRNEGHEEFRAFYDKMMNGNNKIVGEISSDFEVDDTSFLYGKDTAVARGSQSDHFVLTDGSDFTLDSKWTATVCRIDGGWKVTSFHVSANIFDNPILSVATGWIMKAAVIAGIIALILGFLIGRAGRKKATA